MNSLKKIQDLGTWFEIARLQLEPVLGLDCPDPKKYTVIYASREYNRQRLEKLYLVTTDPETD
jgi:hypothetical protein